MPAAIANASCFVRQATSVASAAAAMRIPASPREPSSDGVTSAANTAIGTKCRNRSQNAGRFIRTESPVTREPKVTATMPAQVAQKLTPALPAASAQRRAAPRRRGGRPRGAGGEPLRGGAPQAARQTGRQPPPPAGGAAARGARGRQPGTRSPPPDVLDRE